MKLSHFTSALSLVSLAAATSLSTVAYAEEPGVSVVSGQFAERVEAGKPSGDANAISAARKAVYFVDIANPGAASTVTLVWSLDGNEVQRQSLDVGRSNHWRTWGARPLGAAKIIRVEVLDASGKSLKEDSLTLGAPAA